jgi:hypothetical protein
MSGWDLRRRAEIDAGREAELEAEARIEAAQSACTDLVVVDTANVVELRRQHPGLFGDLSPAEKADAYARHVDELAALLERHQAAHDGLMRVLLPSLAELHGALDELVEELGGPPGDAA